MLEPERKGDRVMTSDRKRERKENRTCARSAWNDASGCVEEKLKRDKKKEEREREKNYTERADLLVYREVRIYIKKKGRLVNDKKEK